MPRKAPNTVNAQLTAVDDFYRHLGLGPANAIDRTDTPRPSRRSLDKNQQHQLLRGTQQLCPIRDRAIVYTLYYAGLRAPELVALDVNDVPTTARTNKIVVRVGSGPGYGQPRTIPAEPRLCMTLVNYRQARLALPGAESCRALFLNRYGRRLSAHSVAMLVASLGLAIGLDDLTPRVLRNTFANNMLSDGADLMLLSQLLGHATVHATRAYVSSTGSDRKRRTIPPNPEHPTSRGRGARRVLGSQSDNGAC